MLSRPSRSLGLALLVSALAPLAACGGSSPAGTGGGTTSTDTSTGGAGGSCPAGSHPDTPGTCATTLEAWTQASTLLSARDHHVTFAATTPAGTFLYVAGGTNNSSVFDSVERASVAADGTLGAFTNTATLPKANLGMGLAQVGNAVVLAGGADGFDSLADAWVGAVADDGSIAFAAGPPLGVDRYHVSLSEHGGYVYAIGGLQQKYNGGSPTQAVMDTVERATFDGKTLGAWETIDPLPMPLTHQAAVVYEDALYLIGGISATTTLTAIVRAPFTADGHLDAFTQVGTLPEGRGTSAAFVFLDQLYVVAGASKAQGGEVDTVLRAPIDAAGMVGAFEMLAPLPQPRAHVHQTPVVGGFVYSAGGIHGAKIEKEVYSARLD